MNTDDQLLEWIFAKCVPAVQKLGVLTDATIGPTHIAFYPGDTRFAITPVNAIYCLLYLEESGSTLDTLTIAEARELQECLTS